SRGCPGAALRAVPAEWPAGRRSAYLPVDFLAVEVFFAAVVFLAPVVEVLFAAVVFLAPVELDLPAASFLAASALLAALCAVDLAWLPAFSAVSAALSEAFFASAATSSPASLTSPAVRPASAAAR